MTGLPGLPMAGASAAAARPRLPDWFKVRPPQGDQYRAIRTALRERGLATVCEEARCPNLSECWSGGDGGVGTATIMVLGDTCTRGCRFCAVATGRPPPPDPEEPRKASETVGIMGVGYVVVTSVDRDDLPDGGADHFGKVIERMKADHPDLLVEVLTPDFQGDRAALSRIVAAGPDVVAHNVETVRRLSPTVRDRRASYDQSLDVLRTYKELGAAWTKTSIMLGLGEREQEVTDAMHDLRRVDCDVITFGQYLRPSQSAAHLPVVEFVHPDRFQALAEQARGMGFRHVASGPLVRSSYRAGELFMEGMLRDQRRGSLTPPPA